MWSEEMQGGPDKPCTGIRCLFNRNGVKSKATHFNRRENRWVCVWCAQEINGKELALKIEKNKLSCITGKQYTYEQLCK